MVEQLFSAYHHSQKSKQSADSAAASAIAAKADMETTKSYMENSLNYMETTQGYMNTTQGYMDTTEAAVVKLEEVDTVVENAKVEITNLSASEQLNIQNKAAAETDAAVITINETRDAAVITVNEAKDSSVEEAMAIIDEKADSYVDKTSTQTITGDKTFTGAVNVPTPASDAAGTTAINAEWANSRIISVMENVSSICNKIYPVGSIYIGTQSTCPIASLIEGSTWELVAKDRVLQGAGTRGTVGTTLEESLPNITGSFYALDQINAYSGAFYRGATVAGGYGGAGSYDYRQQIMNASRSSSTYQNGAPVQPDAYLVNIWRRTA